MTHRRRAGRRQCAAVRHPRKAARLLVTDASVYYAAVRSFLPPHVSTGPMTSPPASPHLTKADMTASLAHPFQAHDALQPSAPANAQPGWFDRFYFNVHDGSASPYVLLGAGVYPVEGVVDGYVLAVTRDEQINLRMSDELAAGTGSGVGPLSWEMIEPLKRWRVRLDANPSGVAFDLEWTATTAFWATDRMHLDDGRGRTAAFDHGFQSGRHEGWIEIDGQRHEVARWTGQRDRSRGTRLPAARQGVHLWVQAQFEDACLGFNLDLDRANRQTLLDGAWMGRDGSLDKIVAVGHDLEFDADLELVRGRLRVRTQSGRVADLEADLTVSEGGYMACAGYGGWHGQPRGRGVIEHERLNLAERAGRMRSLSTPLTDRLAAFVRRDAGGGAPVAGAGILEFAHSRSAAFRYTPQLD